MAQTSVTFRDIDRQDHYTSCLSSLKSTSSDNFLVKFNANKAECAINLTSQQVLSEVNQDSHRLLCRWFNFWGHSIDHHNAVAILAKEYDVSPRLIHLLCPRMRSTHTAPPQQQGNTGSPAHHVLNFRRREGDIEKASTATATATPSFPSLKDQEKGSGKKQLTSITDIADDLWHFCSVDWGHRYVCIGYNALFSIPDQVVTENRPAAVRVWSALLLCDDGTMISVFEHPPNLPDSALAIVRQNQLNVFSYLSQIRIQAPSQNVLMQVSIRPLHQDGQDSSSKPYDVTDGASLLFYYLFDDWINTYGLISRRQHPYRKTLDNVRKDMTYRADVQLVESLHQVGRQLTVLKLVYRSYELIVNRILQRQRSLNTATSTQAPRGWPRPGMSQSFDTQTFDDQVSLNFTELDNHGTTTRLTLGAIVRFERLLDRIRLYALTEIDECLAEKESLVFMNFNLVALKESHAIERLTRTTILLAKATILFLPVSLMTAYFSMQFTEIDQLYSLRTYWFCFLVVIVVTLLFLLVFGAFSHTVEGLTIYKGLGRMIWDKRKSQKVKHV